MSRITAQDDITSIILKMSDMNPGAMKVLNKMLASPEAFAPADPFIKILSLDTLGIYGPDIWDLGRYVCRDLDMHVLSSVLQNCAFGKISNAELKEHIRCRKPFESLLTSDELSADFQGQYERDDLVGTVKSQGTVMNQVRPFNTSRVDTHDNMPFEDFIKMLEERGFMCGCFKKLTGNEAWTVFYQPKTGFIAQFEVAPGKTLRYSDGKMTTQCISKSTEIYSLVSGDIMGISNDTLVCTKSIWRDIFAWYDALCPCEKRLPFVTNKQSLTTGATFMDSIQSKYFDEFCEVSNTSHILLLSVFNDICTLSNLELFDAGLQNMLRQVKADMGTIINAGIKWCLDSRVSIETISLALDFVLTKLGKDKNWLTVNGVDLRVLSDTDQAPFVVTSLFNR